MSVSELLHIVGAKLLIVFAALASAFGGAHYAADVPETPLVVAVQPSAEPEKTDVTDAKPAPTEEEPAPEEVPAATVKEPTVPTEIAEEKQIVIALPPPPIIVPLPFTEVNVRTRAALVNILCTTKYGGSLNPISASGVIVDPRGVIVTNAHVAQYFLLRDYPTPRNIECVVRVGSPAEPRYTAELLLVSPQWVYDNAAMIVAPDPTGTGENDYAFLRITGTTNPEGTLPSSFPSVAPDSTERAISTGDQALTAGYPAGFLGGISIQRELYANSSVTPVGEIFTFDSFVDLFSIGGSVVAQKGASGGAVVDMRGRLVGIIVTSTDSETTGGRDLRAITLAHVDRSLARHSGTTFAELLSGDLAAKAAAFRTGTAPTLAKILTEVLER